MTLNMQDTSVVHLNHDQLLSSHQMDLKFPSHLACPTSLSFILRLHASGMFRPMGLGFGSFYRCSLRSISIDEIAVAADAVNCYLVID